MIVWNLSMLDDKGEQFDQLFSTREKVQEEQLKLLDHNFTFLKLTVWEVEGLPLKADENEERDFYTDFYYTVSLNTRIILENGWGKFSSELLMVCGGKDKAVEFANQNAYRFYKDSWKTYVGEHHYLVQNNLAQHSTNPLFPVISMGQTFLDVSLADRISRYLSEKLTK